MSKLIYFDIETAGIHRTYNDLSLANLHLSEAFRDNMSIRDYPGYPDNIEEKWKKACSVNPEYGLIACISYGIEKDGQLKIASIRGTEDQILLKWKQLCILALRDGYSLCGWNIKNFDIPWLYRKMISYSMVLPENMKIWKQKPWESTLIDLKEVWRCGSTINATFDEALIMCDIDSPKTGDVHGSTVHKHYWDGNIDGICKYCEHDVKSLWELDKKLKLSGLQY
jgi:predicted PolB exonuclease-like 3'-5' exonuclease